MVFWSDDLLKDPLLPDDIGYYVPKVLLSRGLRECW